MAEETYAWQCKNCGTVIPENHATDLQVVPACCHVCQHGVIVSENPHMGMANVRPDPDNWIILADLKKDELAKDAKRKDLKPEQIVRHVVKRTKSHPRRMVVDNRT